MPSTDLLKLLHATDWNDGPAKKLLKSADQSLNLLKGRIKI